MTNAEIREVLEQLQGQNIMFSYPWPFGGYIGLSTEEVLHRYRASDDIAFLAGIAGVSYEHMHRVYQWLFHEERQCSAITQGGQRCKNPVQIDIGNYGPKEIRSFTFGRDDRCSVHVAE
jgi:hypothetical protein